jgi:hypothetical protein
VSPGWRMAGGAGGSPGRARRRFGGGALLSRGGGRGSRRRGGCRGRRGGRSATRRPFRRPRCAGGRGRARRGGRRFGGGRRGGASGSAARHSRRQQREGVDVSVFVCRDAHTQVEVRLVEFRVSARPHRPDRIAFADRCALPHRDRTEVREGDRIAVLCLDGDDLAAGGHAAGEGDSSTGRGQDIRARSFGNVDPPVLASGIGAATVERELPQDRTTGRPCPCLGLSWENQPYEHEQQDPAHRASSLSATPTTNPKYR